ncbi:MAG: M14 family zinc carboxypeptidase [Planctomycetota bacterium]
MIPTRTLLPLLFAAPPALAQTATVAAPADRLLQPPTLEAYLPEAQTYDVSFPRPESVLGWPVGTWHVRHDQLVRWFEVVAERSPRVGLERYGESHEQRPLVLATITSPANQARIEEIREAHVAAVRSGAESHDGPAVVWMGYGVHGNEPSASNASLLLLYHLAAATGPEIEAFLDRTIVLIDPCMNPDGNARFAQWANVHRGKNLTGDPRTREHAEAWPGGRTNHYWFDLNRDWLLLTHPESRSRVERFQRWLPVVHTDYHEMGSSSTYFFQPGIPSRRNPLTPKRNEELTAAIASFHARALDELGSLYYTQESFDDFYYGKGSTYPDIQGGIGILFEQASARGHLMDTRHGTLSFPFTIRNQFTTSLSTLRAVDELRGDLTSYQRKFYRDALAEAAASEVAGYVFASDDAFRASEMVDRLLRHGIEVYGTGASLDGIAGPAYAVPLEQPQSRLVRALFETRTSWDDNTFYDVSSWTFPLSFDLACEPIARGDWSPDVLGERVEEAFPTEWPRLSADAGAPAYAFEWWTSGRAPRALQTLLERGVRAYAATEPFGFDAPGRDGGARALERGTIVVPVGVQDELGRDALLAALNEAQADGVIVEAVPSGLTSVGPDLGSGSLTPLVAPRPLLLIGSGVSAYEAGEVWHELDTRVGMAVALVEKDRFAGLDLDENTHLILVSGATSGWGESEAAKLRSWVRSGGHVIATKRAAVWVADNLMTSRSEEDDEAADEEEPTSLTYGDYRDLRAVQRVAGTIFEARLDRTHPLCFGFERDTLPVFRNFEAVLTEATDPFATPVRYVDEPLISGFASEENVIKIAGTPAVRAERMGDGTVIALVDDPVFRGVWYGTRRFLHNAIFFADAIRRTGPIETSGND